MAIRRLPVIQTPTGDDAEAAARPAWHWVLIGSGFLVTAFLPTVLAALALVRVSWVARWGSAGALTAAAASASLALSAGLSGYWVARFAPQTRPRHAALGGLLGGLELWALALLGSGFGTLVEGATSLLVLAGLGLGFCVLGAWLHRRGKSAGQRRS